MILGCRQRHAIIHQHHAAAMLRWVHCCRRVSWVQAQRGTPLGRLAKRYLHASALVPDAIFNDLVAARLEQMDALQFGYVLDGYPHTRAQVAFLTERGLEPDKVLPSLLFSMKPKPHAVSFWVREGHRVDFRLFYIRRVQF